jgi:hypothetical protein
MTEDQMLNRIAIDAALAKLEPADAVMMRLIAGLEPPGDWPFEVVPWPPKFELIGHYIGITYETDRQPLSEATIRYRRDVVEDFWAGKRTTTRRLKKGPAGEAAGRASPAEPRRARATRARAAKKSAKQPAKHPAKSAKTGKAARKSR